MSLIRNEYILYNVANLIQLKFPVSDYVFIVLESLISEAVTFHNDSPHNRRKC